MDYTHVQITTPRLRLRPLSAIDVDRWFSMMSDAALLRHWSHEPWYSREQAEEDIAQSVGDMIRGEYLRLGMVRETDQTLIGMVIFFGHHESSARGEIGYCLATDAQGQGYMQEALQAFIGWLKTQLGIRRLEADIHPDNLGSEKTLLRLGFQLEGLLRERWDVGGEISDSKVFGLLLAPSRTQQG
ncbi:GNAT family N-acetyltransferase [Enterobacterales bacterium CwR94]|nr:GNAT family N-acetyltransferase [Enterobacterales bacterium CwR94]